MRLVTYRSDDRTAVGAVDDSDRVNDLTDALGSADLVDAIARWDELAAVVSSTDPASGRPLSEVKLLAPIPRPRRNVVWVGRNYSEHAREFGSSGYDSGADTAKGADHVPSAPVVFTKPASSVVGT